MALPCGTTGSLCSTFVPDRPVCLSVKLPYAIALYARLPSVLREPLEASVTLLDANAPIKLAAEHCYFKQRLDCRQAKGGSSAMTPQHLAMLLQSLPPILHITYPKPILSYSKGARGLF